MRKIIIAAMAAVTVLVIMAQISRVEKEDREFRIRTEELEREVYSLGQISRIEEEISAVRTELRKSFGDTILAYPIYNAHIKHEVSSNLIMRVIDIESTFKAQAVSEAGAQGYMQIIPSTVELFLPLLGKTEYDPFDVEDNIDLGTFIYSFLLAQYNGDLGLAAADYHGGPTGARMYRTNQWEKIPRTAQYVNKITKNYQMLNMM